jgi:outer membrane protein TolC
MRLRLLCGVTAVALSVAGEARAEGPALRLQDVIVLARQHRAEIVAARARARASAERPTMVSALDDPMILPSIDHLPFMLGGVDASIVIEQRFPLSGIRGHRQRAAEADARGSVADADRVQLDVELDATLAFLMVREERKMTTFLAEQRALADQLVAASTARYGAGKGAQAEVLRAEIEVARLDGDVQANAAEVRAAEAMLNTSMGRDPDVAVPELGPATTDDPPAAKSVVTAALDRRPELRMGRAEIERSHADISVMNDMYKPMAMVQTGPSYTMADGPGWMLMIGVSIPLWRGKLHAGVREAEAMSDMASQDLVAMTRMVIGDAVVARERVVAARARWLALRDQVVPRAKAAIDPTLSAYSAGQLPLVSVLEAAEALWSAQMELVKSERELGVAWARLSRATANGGPP